MLELVLFVLPLGLDTFAVSAALGMRGLPRRQRLRVSLVMSGFEMAMPVVGLLVGHALGHFVGSAADYLAIGVLALLGAWMLLHEEDEREKERYLVVPVTDSAPVTTAADDRARASPSGLGVRMPRRMQVTTLGGWGCAGSG